MMHCSHLQMILAEGFFRLQLKKKQLLVSSCLFSLWKLVLNKELIVQATASRNYHEMMCSTLVLWQWLANPFSPKIFVKTLEIPMKFIKQLLKHLLNVLSFKYKRPPHVRVFCYGYKREVEKEVKGRTTSIFSVAMLQNLNDYYSKIKYRLYINNQNNGNEP